MPGTSTCLGDDADDLEALENHYLRRQHLRRHQDDLLIAFQASPGVLVQCQLRHDALGDVADVGHALLQIFILNFLEKLGIIVEHLLQGGTRIHLFGKDDRFYLGDKGRVAQEQTMPAENGGFILAHLLTDAGHDGIDFLAGADDGIFETSYFARKRPPSRCRGSSWASTSSTQYARATTMPGETGTPFSMRLL